MIVYLDKYLSIILYFQIYNLIAYKQRVKMDDRFLKMSGGLHSPTSVNSD